MEDEEEGFKCPYCDFVAKNQGGLSLHIDAKHNDEEIEEEEGGMIEKEEETKVPEEYQELGREEKVLKLLDDDQFKMDKKLRVLRMSVREGVVPDESLFEQMQDILDLMKEHRAIY